MLFLRIVATWSVVTSASSDSEAVLAAASDEGGERVALDAPEATRAKPAKRIDPEDGQAYTKRQTMEYYQKDFSREGILHWWYAEMEPMRKRKRSGTAMIQKVAPVEIKSKDERLKCPHYQQMSCVLDALEKTCESDEGSPLNLIKMNAHESVWACCCPLPYKTCQASQTQPKCAELMKKHIKPLMESSKTTATAIQKALQKVRGGLRDDSSACEVLAKEEPLSQCGSELTPKVKRSIGRADLFCEMLTWQWEELGDSNSAEFKRNGCPYDKNAGKSYSAGLKRKGGIYSSKDF